MIETIAATEFAAALRSLGITPGDVVLVHSRLFALGVPEGARRREEQLQFYVDGLQGALGSRGTLVVLTSFEDYGRYETRFVLEESPSRAGALSEYVRTRPGAVRWLHPLFSIAALGAKAADICTPGQSNAFGYNSAWDRLVQVDAKMLFLGVTMAEAMTFAHYVEHRHGVPYTYTKLHRGEVWANRQLVDRPFTASVRYLDFEISYDLRRLEAALFAAGVARAVELGQASAQVVACRDTLEVGARCLDEDLYCFLTRKPEFRSGEKPMDGAAGDAPEKLCSQP
jgi:aminoglycoside 3-N-acetyltransferase